MKIFICMYEERGFEGRTLKDAYEGIRDHVGDHIAPDDCEFFEAERIEVEFKLEKKEVVSKISKKAGCGA